MQPHPQNAQVLRGASEVHLELPWKCQQARMVFTQIPEGQDEPIGGGDETHPATTTVAVDRTSRQDSPRCGLRTAGQPQDARERTQGAEAEPRLMGRAQEPREQLKCKRWRPSLAPRPRRGLVM